MPYLSEFKEWLQDRQIKIADADTLAALKMIQLFETEQDAPVLGDQEEEEGDIVLSCWMEPNQTWAGEVWTGDAKICEIVNGKSPEALTENLREEYGIFITKTEIKPLASKR